ncbi:MAG: hypothetical protein WCB23_15665, partial [Pseudolabrys sp.]
MEQQLQAIVTVLSLVNPVICGVERALEAFARSGVKRTLLESGHLLTNSITSSTRKSRAAGGFSGQFVMNSRCGPRGVKDRVSCSGVGTSEIRQWRTFVRHYILERC